MRANAFFMHKECQDVCIKVREILQDGEVIVAKVKWFNLGYGGKPWPVSSGEILRIDRAARSNWVNITDKIYNKRTMPGLP